jgi:protein-S-isoprenylcysteine O-methyltransferase Ste14
VDKDSRGGAGALPIARAVLALPGVVLGVIPAALVALAPGPPLRPLPWPLLAAAPAAAGLALMAWTIRLFAVRGKGTLAPWDAPQRLVVEGPYRHVRNPMILGVLLVLAGEATALRAPLLWAWLGLFAAVNLVYVARVEEKRLASRFGAAYDAYRARVPAWIPRLAPWDGA